MQLLVAWLVLGFCFSANTLSNLSSFPMMFAVSLVTLGLGFVGHELAHRYLARRYGCWAEFRLWGWGLLMAIVFALISGGRMIFAAPGAVYIAPRSYGLGYGITQKQNGLISLSGPVANILVALLLLLLSGSGGFIGLVGSTGFRVNTWLAAFNLLPFGMLDGRKVFSWSRVIWAIVTVPAWLTIFLL
jgi:Zn-dependent protease